jgi:hypothetical protein
MCVGVVVTVSPATSAVRAVALAATSKVAQSVSLSTVGWPRIATRWDQIPRGATMSGAIWCPEYTPDQAESRGWDIGVKGQVLEWDRPVGETAGVPGGRVDRTAPHPLRAERAQLARLSGGDGRGAGLHDEGPCRARLPR